MKFRDEVITLIQAGVKPALGCTEPGAVALAAAYAGQALGAEIPTKVEVCVDSNVYKNGVAVGIPGTGKVGLAIAAALGALIKEPALELSVLSRITPELLTMADTMLAGDMAKLWPGLFRSLVRLLVMMRCEILLGKQNQGLTCATLWIIKKSYWSTYQKARWAS